MVMFGSAGNPDSFYQQGHRASLDMPAWLAALGLDSYEYQCTHGVNIRQTTAETIGEACCKHNIRLSVHAPYYINTATEDDHTLVNTKRHLLNSLRVARWMGAYLIVFHPGSCKGGRDAALERSKHCLDEVLETAVQEDLTDIKLAPETMGKKNQLGNLREVIALCKLSPQLVPAVDFGHLHAVSGGMLTEQDHFRMVFDEIAAELGECVADQLHIHFSPVEFTAAGEKRHWTLLDDFGPRFEPLAAVLAERCYHCNVISETAGRQAEDALLMKQMWQDRCR